VHKEEDLLDLPLTNLLLWPGVKYHTRLEYLGDKTSMLQRERIGILKKTATVVIDAFMKLNIKPFLEAGTLLGYMRHHGNMLPWDDDVDIGIYAPDCEKLFPEAEKLHEEFSKIIDLNKYEITRPINCRGNFYNGKMRDLSGRVMDRYSGFYVDIDAYVPVAENRAATLPALPEKDEFWIQTDSDYYRLFIPSSYIFPLQKVPYGESSAYIPNKPFQFLACDIGTELDVPTFRWGVAAYTHVSPMSYVLATVLGVICANLGFRVAGGLAVLLFGGSLRAMYLLAATLVLVYLVRVSKKAAAAKTAGVGRSVVVSLLALTLTASLCFDIFFAARIFPYNFKISDVILVPKEVTLHKAPEVLPPGTIF
jgi:hypothetical protein